MRLFPSSTVITPKSSFRLGIAAAVACLTFGGNRAYSSAVLFLTRFHHYSKFYRNVDNLIAKDYSSSDSDCLQRYCRTIELHHVYLDNV